MKGDIKFQRPLNAEQKKLFGNMRAAIKSDGIDTVSFEMFEMLVLRPYFDRLDVGIFMEREFKDVYIGSKTFYELRCAAEKSVSEKSQKKLKPFNMEDIYEKLMKLGKISDSSRRKLMERECELEEYFCFPRKTGRELFKLAKTEGKKVVITADTYLPRKTVESILQNCGYNGYDALYITSEEGIAKSPDGALFRKICEDMKLVPNKALHFGCSFEADAEAPIRQGMKAMFITSCRDRLVKSGRLCGFIQKELMFDFNEAKHISLRCILGIYAAYAFDCPHSKTVHSDFCSDDYMLGFIILGAMSRYKDYVVESELDAHILGALSRLPNAVKGAEDFELMYDDIFSGASEKYGFSGCQLPFVYFARHGAIGDRMSIQKLLPPEILAEWADIVTEPEIAPVFTKHYEKNALSRFADKLFPHGSKIRTILDRIIAKLH